jgi:hypothetical protein
LAASSCCASSESDPRPTQARAVFDYAFQHLASTLGLHASRQERRFHDASVEGFWIELQGNRRPLRRTRRIVGIQVKQRENASRTGVGACRGFILSRDAHGFLEQAQVMARRHQHPDHAWRLRPRRATCVEMLLGCGEIAETVAAKSHVHPNRIVGRSRRLELSQHFECWLISALADQPGRLVEQGTRVRWRGSERGICELHDDFVLAGLRREVDTFAAQGSIGGIGLQELAQPSELVR